MKDSLRRRNNLINYKLVTNTYSMKFYYILFFTLFTSLIYAQKELPVDTMVVSQHSVTINGKNINYTTQTGTQPVWNKSGKAVAGLFYTYYKRNDVKNVENRPLIISFNGGPGSASVWMHLAYTGPRILKIDE